jgi:hypothetical protein
MRIAIVAYTVCGIWKKRFATVLAEWGCQGADGRKAGWAEDRATFFASGAVWWEEKVKNTLYDILRLA